MKLIECVPNFSEGRDMSVIREITDAFEQRGMGDFAGHACWAPELSGISPSDRK